MSTTGNHATGNLLNSTAEPTEIETEGLIWIEQEDQGKQRMARKGNMKAARAASNHPHLAGEESQGGRQ